MSSIFYVLNHTLTSRRIEIYIMLFIELQIPLRRNVYIEVLAIAHLSLKTFFLI